MSHITSNNSRIRHRGSRPLVAATVAGIALAAAVTVPALTGAKGQGGRDITAREKARAVKFIRDKPSKNNQRLRFGDRVVTRQGLFDERDRAIGTLFTDCVNQGRSRLQCVATYRFDDGQVVSAGVFRPGAGDQFPIVGGSGAYQGARGAVTAGAAVKGYDSVDVLQLDG